MIDSYWFSDICECTFRISISLLDLLLFNIINGSFKYLPDKLLVLFFLLWQIKPFICMDLMFVLNADNKIDLHVYGNDVLHSFKHFFNKKNVTHCARMYIYYLYTLIYQLKWIHMSTKHLTDHYSSNIIITMLL